MALDCFQEELDARISKYDLLTHPYYQAWTHGELSRDDICSYAVNYFHYIAAFPGLLDGIAERCSDSQLKAAASLNRADEEGGYSNGRPHKELWLDFAEGMGADREATRRSAPVAEIQALIDGYKQIVETCSPLEAVSALYAFESQQPRVSREKNCSLQEKYGADERTRAYFTTHAEEDTEHAKIWVDELSRGISREPALKQCVLDAAEKAARYLWHALDGVERIRRQTAPAYQAV